MYFRVFKKTHIFPEPPAFYDRHCTVLYKGKILTVDCQQLKWTGARSAGRSVACMTSFRLPARAQHENVGRGLAR